VRPMVSKFNKSLCKRVRLRERGRVMKATPAFCGDHLVPITECDCLSYMREIASSAEKLIQLTKEREELSK